VSRHLLVTNDFPPKIGGIQQYLWELWRRLDPTTFEVHTTPYQGAATFDAEQPYVTHRSQEPVLLPYPWLARRLDEAADRFGASLHVIDPAVPLGLIGPTLAKPYAVVLHGAEVTVPGRLPGSRQALARVLNNAVGVISAGEYALAEAERAAGRSLDAAVIPPGVDTGRFLPADTEERRRIRARYGVDPGAPFILSVSRLVPRKGMDTLIEAAARLRRHHPSLLVGIAGDGRDRRRLQNLIDARNAPVRLFGRISEEDKARLYGASDLFVMLCRSRWAGLEQEGFGIVFVEAAAAGVAQVAGRSGGAHEAVADGETGIVVDEDASIDSVAAAIDHLLSDDAARQRLGQNARERAEREFSYDVLAARLAETLQRWT
jgi:phosphatidylinositol alpha-1,6-mannosyltransferase